MRGCREPIPAASAPESPVASPVKSQRKPPKSKAVVAALPEPEPTVAPPAAKAPDIGEILAKERAELHLFDVASGTFILQDPEVTATVWEVGNWDCEYHPVIYMEIKANVFRLAAN